MIIFKILLIIIWVIGAYIIFLYLPNPKFDQWFKKRFSKVEIESIKDTQILTTKEVAKKEDVVLKVIEEEKEVEKEDDVDFANVEIFSSTLNIRQGFYPSLTNSQKKLFDEMYVLNHPSHLVKSLQFDPKGDNQLFFKYVFNSLYTYRKVISLELLKVLTDELLFLSDDNAEIQTILYEIATRTAYFRRKDTAFLDYAHSLSDLDVQLNRNKLKRKDCYVYSYTRLAIILEKKKLYKEALAIVDEAIKLNLDDKTVQGYDGRKNRILEKMRKLS